jgi:LytS/YehU family sensor histidine kinase
MNLSVTDKRVLELNIENSRNTEADNIPILSGIGLANVQRRLKLVYPDKHELCICKESARFKVALKIDLA